MFDVVFRGASCFRRKGNAGKNGAADGNLVEKMSHWCCICNIRVIFYQNDAPCQLMRAFERFTPARTKRPRLSKEPRPLMPDGRRPLSHHQPPVVRPVPLRLAGMKRRLPRVLANVLRLRSCSGYPRCRAILLRCPRLRCVPRRPRGR